MNNLHEKNRADWTVRLSQVEPALYLAAFGLALALRWLNLGAAPLGDAEASWAMQALSAARPALAAQAAASQSGANPGYVFPTGALFWLFGATDFAARAWPALSGALVVAATYLFRRDLGRPAALILAFGLAIDPGLVTVSRQAGGPMAAAVFSLLAIGLWRAGFAAPAGITAGLALLSGPGILPGALALVLAAWAAAAAARRLTERYTHGDASGDPTAGWDEERPALPAAPPPTRRRTALAAAVGTLILVGTLLLRFPQGLQGLFSGLIVYLQNWSVLAPVSPLILLLALFVFELLPLSFAAVHLVRMALEWQTRADEETTLTVFALVWALAALALTLIYPGRQTGDLVWVILPLWTLAASEIACYIPEERPHWMTYVMAITVVLLTALFWLALITTPVVISQDVPWEMLRLVILLGILVLTVLTCALVALGWSWPISRDGSAWGALAALLVFSVATMWGASQLRPNQPLELWGQGPGPGQERLLAATLRDVSLWKLGMAHEVEVVSTVDTPSLRWLLRDYANARFTNLAGIAASQSSAPSIVITSDQEQSPELAAGYRGQDFVWWSLPGWSGALPDSIKDWLTYRRAPLNYQHIILWARSDLFPGAAAAGSNTAP